MPREDIYKSGLKTRFKKGQGGRPKGALSIKSRLKNLCSQTMDFQSVLDDPEIKTKSKKEVYDIIAHTMIAQALQGDLKAIKMVIDYVDDNKTDDIVEVLSKAQLTKIAQAIVDESNCN